MLKKIVGGTMTLIIGGTVFTISQSNITENFSANTGMNQQQAEQYIKDIPQDELVSFSEIGEELVSDGNSSLLLSDDIDCINYTYPWVNSSLSCVDGKKQLQKIGNDEVTLGNCLQTLDTNLKKFAEVKISECILDIDTVNKNYNLPIITAIFDSDTITSFTHTLAYNKSVLQAALEK